MDSQHATYVSSEPASFDRGHSWVQAPSPATEARRGRRVAGSYCLMLPIGCPIAGTFVEEVDMPELLIVDTLRPIPNVRTYRG